MTFEQKLKELLKNDFNEMFGLQTDYYKLITVANDISSRALSKKDSFLAVVKTGQGLRTAIPGYDVVNLSLYIEFYFDRNFLQDFLSEMKDYIDSTNAHSKTVEIDNSLINYRINFNNPTPSATALDQEVEGRTMQFSQVILMGEVIYSEQLNFDAPEIKFEYYFDEENSYLIEIKNILNYNMMKQPATETTQLLGGSISKKEIISYETTHSVSKLITDSDLLVQFITSNFSQSNRMVLLVDEKIYEIQNIIATLRWENGIKTLECVFVE